MKTKKKFPIKNVSLPKKQNPFEVHVNRSKYEVLGRKLKSDHGLPGVSKHKALQKRKATLLQEYKWKDKANHFIDSRIGERNGEMTEDDRLMARFAAERKRMFNKKTMFNLSETEVLTHRGQTLSEIEKFEETRSDDEDPDDTGALRGRFVSDAHFGGGVLSQGKQDRESIINQLIIESNKRIAERKRNKEQTLEATEQLDEEWKTLGTIVTEKPKDEDVVNTKRNDKYDIVMRQFKFEPQAQATQRLKTDEEVAKEEREKLEKLEKERLKQLREIEATKYGNHRSADDLDDGFFNIMEVYEEDVLAGKDGGSGSDDEGNDESGDDEMEHESAENIEDGNEDDVNDNDDGEDENNDEDDNYCETTKSTASVKLKSDKKQVSAKENKTKKVKVEKTKSIEKDKLNQKADEEEAMETSNIDSSEKSDPETSEDEEDAMEDLADLMPSIKGKSKTKKKQSKMEKTVLKAKEADVIEMTKQKKKLKLDLPYVLNVPDDFDSFKQLLLPRTAEEQDIIFERIIKSNHPNLKPENKKKMLNLAEYVIQLLSSESVSWTTLLVLVKHWATLKEFNTAECLLALVDSIKPIVGVFDPDSLVDGSSLDCAVKHVVWYSLLVAQPRGVEVLLPLSQPVMSLICKYLSHIHPRSWQDIPVGILLSHLLLKDAEKSSTVYTEGIIFLHHCVKESVKCEKCHKQRFGPLCKCGSDELDKKFQTADAKDLTFSFDDSLLNGLESRDPRILYFAVIMLSGFLKAYRKFPQSKILFNPIHITFKKLKIKDFSAPLRKAITDMQELLQVLQLAQIPALMKASKKPKALRQYEPSFHTVTTSKAHRGLPIEKQEEQKLLHKYKHEMKGAMRELRRDRQFLANIKLRERVQSDEQRIKKVKEIYGSAANQQGELRRMKKKK